MPEDEFEQFKSRIDLREYAASLGYELDRRESSRGASVMRDKSGDKVIIKRDRVRKKEQGIYRLRNWRNKGPMGEPRPAG